MPIEGQETRKKRQGDWKQLFKFSCRGKQRNEGGLGREIQGQHRPLRQELSQSI